MTTLVVLEVDSSAVVVVISILVEKKGILSTLVSAEFGSLLHLYMGSTFNWAVAGGSQYEIMLKCVYLYFLQMGIWRYYSYSFDVPTVVESLPSTDSSASSSSCP